MTALVTLFTLMGPMVALLTGALLALVAVAIWRGIRLLRTRSASVPAPRVVT